MKKKIAAILLALVMCFAAFACNDGNSPENNAINLKVINPSIECVMDENVKYTDEEWIAAPDWSSAVRLYIGDAEVDFDVDAIAVQRSTGNANEYTIQKFNIRYTYNGTIYGPERVSVAYKKKQGTGGNTPAIEDKSNMTDEQRTALVTAFATSHDKYSFDFDMLNERVKLSRNELRERTVSVDDETTVTVTNSEIEEKIETLSGQGDNGSSENAWTTEEDSLWYISRERIEENDVVSSDFVSVIANYAEVEGGEPDWIKRTVVYRTYSTSSAFSSFYPLGFELKELGDALNPEWFDYNGDTGLYEARETTFNDVAEAIFGRNTNDFPQSLELTVESGVVTEIDYVFESRGTTSSDDTIIAYHVSWGNFGTATVELPDAEEYTLPAPEYEEPSEAGMLSNDEQTALNAALGSRYDNVTFENYFELQAEAELQEIKGAVTDSRLYSDSRIYQMEFNGGKTLAQSQELYVVKRDNGVRVISMDGDFGDFLERETAETLDDYATMLQPADMNFRASWFANGKDAGTYVVRASALGSVDDAMDNLRASLDYAKLETVSLTVKVDGGNVIEWKYVGKYQDTLSSVPAYMQFGYAYTDIATTVVKLPAGANEGTAVTSAQIEALENILVTDNKLANHSDFDNVTVYDTLTDSTCSFDGTKFKREYVDYSFMGIPIPATNFYGYDEARGKYFYESYNWDYENESDDRYVRDYFDEKDTTSGNDTVYGFDARMPHFHFYQLFDGVSDNAFASRMTYDAENDTYMLRVGMNGTSRDELNALVKDFAYYMYTTDYEYTGIDIVVKDGKLVSIKFHLTSSDLDYAGTVSAVFSDYGATQVVFDSEQSAPEVSEP